MAKAKDKIKDSDTVENIEDAIGYEDQDAVIPIHKVTFHDEYKIQDLCIKHDIKENGINETSVGFSIPFGYSKTDLYEKRQEVNAAELALQHTRIKVSRELQHITALINWLANSSSSLQQAADRLDQQFSELKGSGEVGLLLGIKVKSVEQQRELRRNHVDALRHYIEFLYISGQLASKPLKNWLYTGQPYLQENIHGYLHGDRDEETTRYDYNDTNLIIANTIRSIRYGE